MLIVSKLLRDETILQHDGASGFMNLSCNMTANALGQAKELWTRHETKRRILLAAFVLDTQNSVFFEQPASSLDLITINLPYPQPTQTWECADLGKWRSLVHSGHRPYDLRVLGYDFSSLAPFDAFQSSFISCYQIHRGYHHPTTIMSRYDEIMPCLPETPIHQTSAFLTYFALHLSSLVPIKSLLIVSSASWLFGTKVTELSVWESAKVRLRAWVATEAAARCTSYATQILQIALEGQSLQTLHGKWCIYLAALVCWAYGFSPGQHEVPGRLSVEMATFQAREYLLAMNGSIWMEVSSLSMRWYTRGVLECVRARLHGSVGGLLNQAEDTLAALAEGRNQMMNFWNLHDRLLPPILFFFFFFPAPLRYSDHFSGKAYFFSRGIFSRPLCTFTETASITHQQGEPNMCELHYYYLHFSRHQVDRNRANKTNPTDRPVSGCIIIIPLFDRHTTGMFCVLYLSHPDEGGAGFFAYCILPSSSNPCIFSITLLINFLFFFFFIPPLGITLSSSPSPFFWVWFEMGYYHACNI